MGSYETLVSWDNRDQELLRLIDDNSLSQCVHEPTRKKNILDLLLTTNPDLIHTVNIEPGMSDHRIVVADIGQGEQEKAKDCVSVQEGKYGWR